MVQIDVLKAEIAPDHVIPQDWDSYTPADHAMWDRLFERQAKLLPGRAVPEFMDGLDILRMDRPGIPALRNCRSG